MLVEYDHYFITGNYNAALQGYEDYQKQKSYPEKISYLLGLAATRYNLGFDLEQVFTPISLAKELTFVWIRGENYNYNVTRFLFIYKNGESRYHIVDEMCRILLKVHRTQRKYIKIKDLSDREISGWMYFILGEMVKYYRKEGRISFDNCRLRMETNGFENDVFTGSILEYIPKLRNFKMYQYLRLLLKHYRLRSQGDNTKYLALLMNHDISDACPDESSKSDMAFHLGQIMQEYNNDEILEVFLPFYRAKIEGAKGRAVNSHSDCYGEFYLVKKDDEELLLKFLVSPGMGYHRAFNTAYESIIHLMSESPNSPIYIHAFCISTLDKQLGILPDYKDLDYEKIGRLLQLEEKAIQLYLSNPPNSFIKLANIEDGINKLNFVLNKIQQCSIAKRGKNIKQDQARKLTEVESSGEIQNSWDYTVTYIQELRSMAYKDYLQTEHWEKVRVRAIKRAGFKCVLCGAPQNLEVHHNDYTRRGCELDTDVTVLCGTCHKKFHGFLPAD